MQSRSSNGCYLVAPESDEWWGDATRRQGAVRAEKRARSKQDGPTGATTQERPVRYHDARLQTQWHHHALCGAQRINGKVIGECYPRHRHQEWLKFLRRLDREFPQDLQLHLVMDNYGTHQEPHVKAWLKQHPRFVCHFAPTSSSWLNLVERWFRELSEQAIRRGSFLSVSDLQQAIDEFLQAWNQNPKPFIWTATVGQIIERSAGRGSRWSRSSPDHPTPREKKKGNGKLKGQPS